MTAESRWAVQAPRKASGGEVFCCSVVFERDGLWAMDAAFRAWVAELVRDAPGEHTARADDSWTSFPPRQ